MSNANLFLVDCHQYTYNGVATGILVCSRLYIFQSLRLGRSTTSVFWRANLSIPLTNRITRTYSHAAKTWRRSPARTYEPRSNGRAPFSTSLDPSVRGPKTSLSSGSGVSFSPWPKGGRGQPCSPRLRRLSRADQSPDSRVKTNVALRLIACTYGSRNPCRGALRHRTQQR